MSVTGYDVPSYELDASSGATVMLLIFERAKMLSNEWFSSINTNTFAILPNECRFFILECASLLASLIEKSVVFTVKSRFLPESLLVIVALRSLAYTPMSEPS